MMPVQSTSRPTAGHSGTTNAQVFRFPLAPSSEPYKTLREWREAQGWGRWKTAQALIRSATPEERKSLPEVHVLAGHWARWEKGRNEPDGHRNAPFYKPIIARMMGTTPEKIWPPQRPAQRHRPAPVAPMDVRSDLASRREVIQATLVKFQAELEYLTYVRQTITQLSSELTYLDAMLAVPAPASDLGASS